MKVRRGSYGGGMFQHDGMCVRCCVTVFALTCFGWAAGRRARQSRCSTPCVVARCVPFRLSREEWYGMGLIE